MFLKTLNPIKREIIFSLYTISLAISIYMIQQNLLLFATRGGRLIYREKDLALFTKFIP